jgi:HSP20 family protein
MRNFPSLWRGDRDHPFRELQRQVDRIFDSFLTSGFEPMSNWPTTAALPAMPDLSVASDVRETDNHLVLSFDLPGIRPEDLDIEVNGNLLTISGERRDEFGEEEGEGRQGREGRARAPRGRFYGNFSRSFTLPQEVKPEDVEADFRHGVLHVAIPKVQSEQGSRRVQIGQSRSGIFDRLLGSGNGRERSERGERSQAEASSSQERRGREAQGHAARESQEQKPGRSERRSA